jgi:nucleotide sugar dehydrogenase
MNITIAGLGKIGIPLAVQFASKGAAVTGYDINPSRVAEINAGQNPLPGEPGLDAIADLVSNKRLRATTDARDAVNAAHVIILIVPVDIDESHTPDFTALDAATAAAAPHLKRDALVIVETTVPVGTTRNRVGARLARAGRIAAATGTMPGEDFALAFSPERVSSGRVLRDLATYPKIVGGIDAKSTERAVEFYREMLDAKVEVRAVRDAETAEFTKLIETAYRDVNIALANEFARLADALGVDARQAIDAANSQPYSHIHAPGVGVGGHCIPVYPYFLPGSPGRAAEGAALIETARRINDAMAGYAAQRLSDALDTLEGTTVVVLGLSYRANVKESRHSSTFALVETLTSRGATVYVHDPLYTGDEIRAHNLTPPPSWPLPCDALAIQAWHTQYASLDFASFQGLRAVLDGRGALDPGTVATTKVEYVGIGR